MKQKGFTLIELLVVIVILGILGTIGFANFRGYFGRALDAERKAATLAIGSMIKLRGTTDFSANKYLVIHSGTTELNDFDNIIAANEYKLPKREGSCLYYFYFDGGTTSPTDNEFILVSPLDAPEGDISGDVYNVAAAGAGLNVSAEMDEVRKLAAPACDTAPAKTYYDATVGATATSGFKIDISGDDPSFTDL